jgi:hypothetical protein
MAPPRLPAWCLPRLSPLPPTLEGSLSSSEACLGLRRPKTRVSRLIDCHQASRLLDQPAESAVSEDAAAATATLVFAGLRRSEGRSAESGAAFCLEVHRCTNLPLDSAADDVAAKRATPEGGGGGVGVGGGGDGDGGGARAPPVQQVTEAEWEAWRVLAAEQGVEIDEGLRQQLLKMAQVAHATGRPLGEASVRTFLQRRKAKAAS